MHFSSMMVSLLYKTLTTAVAPLGAAFISYKKRRDPPYGKRVFELLGIYSKKYRSDGCIWFHGASVGEVLALKPLIKEFKLAHPEQKVVLSTMTTTGAASGASLEGVEVVFSPLDSPLALCGFFSRFKPKALVIFETELWPNMLGKAKQKGIPVVIVNARMQEKNLESYLKHKTLVEDLISSKITKVIAISHADGARFEKIGIKDVTVSGNIKYDLSPRDDMFMQSRELKNKYLNGLVFGAVSIHEGEEKSVIEAYLEAKKAIPQLKMVFISRHKAAADNAAIYLTTHHIHFQRRSELPDLKDLHSDILIGDTLGEIEFYFGLCDIAFMGGSFVDVGGHNPLEPAYFSLPVITGPKYHNFKEPFNMMIEKGGAFMAENPKRLSSIIVKLCNDELLRKKTGVKALDIQQQGRGALKFTLEQLEKLLKK